MATTSKEIKPVEVPASSSSKTTSPKEAETAPKKSPMVKILLSLLFLLLVVVLVGGGLYGYQMKANYDAQIASLKKDLAFSKKEVTDLEEELEDIETKAHAKGDDAGYKKDAPDKNENPLIVDFGKFEAEFYGSADEADFYQVNFSGGEIMDITLEPSAGLDAALSLQVYGYDGNYSEEINKTKVGGKEVYRFTTDVESGNNKLIFAVKPIAGTTGKYSVTLTQTKQNDAGSGTDASTNSDDAKKLALGTYNGYLGVQDKADYYAFNVVDGDILQITVKNVQSDFDLGLYFETSKVGDMLVVRYPDGPGLDYTVNDNTKGETETVKVQIKKSFPGTTTKGVLIIGVSNNSGEDEDGKYELKVAKV